MSYNYPGKSSSGDERRLDPLRGGQTDTAKSASDPLDALLDESLIMSEYEREVALANVRRSMPPKAQIKSVVARERDGIVYPSLCAALPKLDVKDVRILVTELLNGGELVIEDGKLFSFFDDRCISGRRGPSGKRPGPNAGKRLGRYGRTAGVK